MNFFKKNMVFLLGFLMTSLLLEAFLQLGEVNSLPEGKQDEVLGTRLKFNHEFLYFNEGFSLGKINRKGYYGPLYLKQKKENINRIALLGDSYVEGVQVFERNHFRNKLESMLNEQTIDGNDVEVLNFGRSGFNLNDIYCYYQNFVKEYNSTTKLVFISPGDLVSEPNNKLKPYAYLNNGKLTIDYSFSKTKQFKKKKASKKYRGKSIILGYMGRTYELVKRDKYKQILFGKFSSITKRGVNSQQKLLHRNSLSKITKKIIVDLSDEGCIFVLHSETTINVYDYLLEEFVNYAKEKNIKTINLSPLFKELKSKKVNYNYWPITKKKGHFNERGHEEIAKFLKKHLTK